jgi:ElaB/YqjD/DUF883 family membrane-anchored ribosome-binding protein
MAENKFENTGDFRGANVIQGSTINAHTIAGTITKADDASRKELQTLIAQLGKVLEATPQEKKEEAEAVSASAEDLMKEASKQIPNKSRLRSLGESLVGMAKTIGAAAPAAITIAEKIVELIGKIHGLS